jgi:photosystem II stability/assembly factor-like uncharacterized protein
MIGFVSLWISAMLAQWVLQNSGTTASLRGLSAADSKAVWASGQKGTYLRTTDGGATWSAGVVPGAEALDFRDLQAFGPDAAVLMSSGPGRQSRVYRTTDGGAHWIQTLQNEDENGFFDAIAFWDSRRGILLGDPVDGRFVLYSTEDGGGMWRRVAASGLPPAHEGEGAFAASGTCLAVGPDGRAWFGTGGSQGGRVFRSEDWGRTWAAADTPIRHDGAAAGIFSIAFADARNGVAVGGDYQKAGDGRDNVILTDDGGVTWRAAPGQRPGGFREAVAWVPRRVTTLIATGPNGTDISNDGGRSWRAFDSRGFHALSFSPAGDGWAAGANGAIGRIPVPASNAELKRIVDEDQADREGFEKHAGDQKWFAELPGRDAKRLSRVREMVSQGVLQTAEDFSAAALVLQHGDKPDDFLLAHVLASAAVIAGNLDARWLSAATLDRYLQKIGQAQVFGTQFQFEGDHPWTMEPYNEKLLPDPFRAIFGVPPIIEQRRQLQEIQRESRQKK